MRNRHLRPFLIGLLILQIVGAVGLGVVGLSAAGLVKYFSFRSSQPVVFLQPIKDPEQFNAPFNGEAGLGWRVVVVPDFKVIEQINTKTHQTIALYVLAFVSATVVATALAIGVGVLSARWILCPVLHISRTSKHSPTQEQRLAQFLEALPVGVVVYQPNGSIFYMNPMAQTLFRQRTLTDMSVDVNSDANSDINGDMNRSMNGDRLAATNQLYQANTNMLCPIEQLPAIRALHGETFTVEDLEIHHGETIIPLTILGTPMVDEHGTVLYAIVTFQDITERKANEQRFHQYQNQLEERIQERTHALRQEILNRQHAEDALRISQEQLRLITDSVPAGIAFVDAERRYRFVNRMYEVRLKRDRKDILGQYIWDVIGQENYNAVREIIDQVFQGNERDIEYEFHYESGETRFLKFMLSPDFDEYQQVRGYYLIFFDITERKRLEDSLKQANHQLARLAAFDGLTKIANRRKFDEYLIQTWNQAARSQTPLSLILFDVDYFKLFNDTYGHQHGDECLIQIAQATQQVVKRSTDLVARYGGEEFVVILPETDSHGAIAIAESIQHTIRTLSIPHEQSEVSQIVTVSLGIATVIPTPEQSITTLITLADQALYEAKQNGRDRYAVNNNSVNDGSQ